MLGIEKIEAKVDVLSTDLALYVGNTATELKSAADAVNAKVSELSSEIEGSREGLEAVNASVTHLSTRVDALSDFFAGKFESLRVLFVEKFLEHLRAEAERTGSHFGIFFDTSGNARVERINDAAQYSYFWRSDINNAEADEAGIDEGVDA